MPMIDVKRPDGSCFKLFQAGDKPSAYELERMKAKRLEFATADDLAACLERAKRNAGEE